MTGAAALSVYTGAILLGALAGGALPLFARFRRSGMFSDNRDAPEKRWRSLRPYRA